MSKSEGNVKLISIMTWFCVVIACLLLFFSFANLTVGSKSKIIYASLDISSTKPTDLEEGDQSSFQLQKANNLQLQEANNNVKIKGKFYCQCDPQFNQVDNMCGCACGITSLANINLKLKKPKQLDPLDMREYALNNPPPIWFSENNSVGEKCGFRSGNFIEFHYKKLGFRYAGVNLVNATRINTVQAKKFLNEGYLILCSNYGEYHVFVVTGICGDDCIEVMDSWKGCQANLGGNTIEDPVIIQKPANYCDFYAYPLK